MIFYHVENLMQKEEETLKCKEKNHLKFLCVG